MNEIRTQKAQSAGRDATPRRGLRIGLAASGGGHLRQLLDLRSVWSAHDHFFITEDTALGRTLSLDHRTHFIPHYAWGQARLGAPFRMLAGAAASFLGCLRIIREERPDLLLTTGAGAVFFAVLWARLFGARVIVIESFARFEGPSLFGRLASRFAHRMIVQSPKLASFYPKAAVFDPLRVLDTPPPPKQPLLFATVGATLPFDRLIRSLADVKAAGGIPERVLAQTGDGGFAPGGMEVIETLPFDQVQVLLRDASIVVCHGGTGSIITALRQGCHVIAMPRQARLGEHYDDHQIEITEAFAARGLVLNVRNAEELAAALTSVRNRRRVVASTEPAELIAFLERELALLAAEPRRG